MTVLQRKEMLRYENTYRREKRRGLTDTERAIKEIIQLLTETDDVEFTMNHKIKNILKNNDL